MSWIDRVAANILHLSNNQSDVAVALKEWFYNGDTYDLEEPCETCQLCDHPDIRYQFTIVNRFTGNALFIGSECITRFDIRAVDATGSDLDAEQTRSKVTQDRRRLIQDAKRRQMINAMIALARADEDFASKLDSFVKHFDNRNAFTPHQLAYLFWRLDEASIEYSKLDFKINIKRGKDQSQLLSMPEWRLKKIWPAMSSSQQRWHMEHK